MFIYLITNLVNGKYYVGQTTKTLARRWALHRFSARHANSTGCKLLVRAMRKHGLENFIIEHLASADTAAQLSELERLWICLLRSTDASVGYNLTFGGEGCCATEQTREAIAAGNRAQFADPEKKARHDAACKSAKRFVGWTPEERRASMKRDVAGNKNPQYGKPWTEAQRANIKAAREKRRLSHLTDIVVSL